MMAFLLDGLKAFPIRDVSELQKGFQLPGALGHTITVLQLRDHY